MDFCVCLHQCFVNQNDFLSDVMLSLCNEFNELHVKKGV